MKILLIDDKPEERLEIIKEAVEEIGPEIEVDSLADNNRESLEKKLSSCDFLILDWHFPEEFPQGEETLNLVRELGFKGPVLIYTVSFERFDEYVCHEEGKVVDFFQEEMGIDSLINSIKRLMPSIRKDKIGSFSVGKKLVYYNDFESMGKHFYHPASTMEFKGKSPASVKKEIEMSLEKVTLVSTGWDAEQRILSGNMAQLIESIEKLAELDIPVLILGESGTGKELAAKLLHFHHKNKNKRYDIEGDTNKDWFMTLNCGAFSESTLNVELFGSLPGAFTDAVDRAGIFEQVTHHDRAGNATHGGTVFLDELVLMGESSQAFFLRVLQENYVYRMGHDEREVQGQGKKNKQGIERRLHGKIPVKFRLVAATNANIFEKVKDGKLRMDLFYRLARAIIFLPELRKRSFEDFNLLFQYFFLRYKKRYGRNIELSHSGDELSGPSRDLVYYLYHSFPWKGNVRELEGLVDTMVAFSEPDRDESDPLTLKDIPGFHWEKQKIFG